MDAANGEKNQPPKNPMKNPFLPNNVDLCWFSEPLRSFKNQVEEPVTKLHQILCNTLNISSFCIYTVSDEVKSYNGRVRNEAFLLNVKCHQWMEFIGML